MGYSYSGVVEGLKEFYSSMRKLNVEIGTFEHTYNGIVSDAIFDTRDSAGLPKDKYHRTSKNLAKTKELYPEIYMATKDMDITIIYGVNPGDKTADLKMGNYRMA